MDDQTKKDVRAMIDAAIRTNFRKKVGDTPTDSLQLTNKMYVTNSISSVFTSVLTGFAIVNNLRVGGSMSVLGTIDVSTFQTGSHVVVGGNASITGNLKVGGTASVAGSVNMHNFLTVAQAITAQGVPIPKTYYGVVASNGTSGTPIPSGWTSSQTGVGSYKVTHNIGDTAYTINATPLTFAAVINTRNTNDFSIATLGSGGSLQNDSFHFTVQHS